MKFALSARSLRGLLLLYAAASLLYFGAATASFYERWQHAATHAHDPFNMDFDSMAVMEMSPEAKAAGLHKGDIVEAVAGKPYTGEAQMKKIDREARPGETLSVGVRDVRGAHRTVNIQLTKANALHLPPAQWLTICITIFCSLVCLLTGYWVVAAKPREPNAWLILLLLSFPEVLFFVPEVWSGALLIFEDFWYQTLQVAGPPVVFLIGVYFPERWRLDRKWPWLKWLLIVPLLIALLLIYLSKYGEYYHPSFGPFSIAISPWLDHIVNPIQLVCVLLYWVAVFDKLRSASTADGRRRMRVLFAGSVIGLGALLVIFVFLRDIGIEPSKYPWLVGTGVVLSLLFPFSLAYVVIVQRAMDVRILVRIGTRYVLARATLIVLEIGLLALFAERLFRLVFAGRRASVADFVVPLILAILIACFAFFGLGKRLQSWLDRRFFREAYRSELVLSELSEQARTLTETQSLISTISRRISEVLHVPQIGVLLRGGRVFRLQESIGLEMTAPLILREDSRTVRNLVAENRPATLYRDRPDGWFAQASDDERAALNSVNAEVLLPLPGRKRLMGVMTLGPKLSEEPYSPSDLRLLQSVATQAGLALEVSELAHSLAREEAQRERLNREIEIAREVQQRFFPQTVPRIPGVTLAGACRPALAVGGDYYDFIDFEDGRTGLAIGDVSGKGISAALLMASLRASLRGMTLEGSKDLAKLMRNVNTLVFEASASNRYATFFFSTFHPGTRELHYVNAGHNTPFILRGAPGNYRHIGLETGGVVVGLMQNLHYEEGSVTLENGDLLLTYTDGISEAMNIDEEEWGEERMLVAAEQVHNLTADAVISHIFKAADQFTGGAPQHDDMTLLVMKVAG